ncbi:MAG: bifunctional (p)ppGpp synthetase/guanosine-3',5'-bis(diphosphate) 3'-pyrophosphohydrolase [Gammaproteobacteria bacterium]|nr:bifunctional (p)ppGpp synthetase/guanosine-3',5'-bis(diphosphate) 3'-pyrophosphohydrolase [Gammaproteobacteria bacterium]MCW5583140.1 bifunctional (p)ppGpp synthetase/guanosine-3',5'-bis(diphosphate) 3'-pyrophosphohydrolase [Gammaproteobacteria bacterium]
MSKHRYPINLEQWMNHLSHLRGEENITLLRSVVDLYGSEHVPQLEKGLGIADILLSLGLDSDTLASALVYPVVQTKDVHLDAITECLGESSNKLLNDVLQMQSLGKLQHLEKRGSYQLENLRKMLLAMVTDVRAVLIVLAERLWQLRHSKYINRTDQQHLANETLSVYAPLANRLGVWQLKWEIEDLCLRYMHPDIYTKIAKGISSRRDDREAYVKNFVKMLTDIIEQAKVKNIQVTGRAKHIYSIYKKMQRKNADLEHIYDMSAIRVMVETIEDCYAVLSILQNHWQQIPEEFDDYITHPKPNGYRSIHIVLIGPKDYYVEVQIRTYQMHQESELGVAAHWRYKEGVLQASSYEAKIALLRQIIEWQKEVVNPDIIPEKAVKDLFADRIYVFTPVGDIIDLPSGATPLDFAYSIHSEVGHRCRGAKADGNIVPLTYELQMGQRVEILTAKHANPSRDWLNPQLGYLKSSRARAKLQHWFRVKDSMQSAVSGRELFEKEPRNSPPKDRAENIRVFEKRVGDRSASNVQIIGINNLLTHIARCCKPLPGDPIIGYITRNRRVSVHRHNCSNVQNILKNSVSRRIDIGWSEESTGFYPTDLLLRVYDRPGLLHDITTMLTSDKINVAGLQTKKDHSSVEVEIYLTIEISNEKQLKIVLDHLQKLPNIIEVKRR